MFAHLKGRFAPTAAGRRSNAIALRIARLIKPFESGPLYDKIIFCLALIQLILNFPKPDEFMPAAKRRSAYRSVIDMIVQII
jgi:hypothetical protein